LIKVLLLALSLPLLLGAQQTWEAPLSDIKFPAEVLANDGKKIDVAQLAKEQRVVVVTLKATWCEVCQQQLVRIKQQLDQLEHCSVTFLVLSPGSTDELDAIQKRTGFPYPFVADRDLNIGATMQLVLDNKKQQLMPAIFILNPDRSVGWIQLGRNTTRFGESQLLAEIDCGDWI